MLDQNLKCFERYCQRNDRTCYRLGENVCKNMYLIRDWYPEYIKNSHKSEIENKWPCYLKLGKIFERVLHWRRGVNLTMEA